MHLTLPSENTIICGEMTTLKNVICFQCTHDIYDVDWQRNYIKICGTEVIIKYGDKVCAECIKTLTNVFGTRKKTHTVGKSN